MESLSRDLTHQARTVAAMLPMSAIARHGVTSGYQNWTTTARSTNDPSATKRHNVSVTSSTGGSRLIPSWRAGAAFGAGLRRSGTFRA